MLKGKLIDPDTGEIVLFLGLTDENLRRLQENEPVKIDLGHLGMTLKTSESSDVANGKILIVHGRDEKSLAAIFGFNLPNPGPGEETRIRIDKNDKGGHGHD